MPGPIQSAYELRLPTELKLCYVAYAAEKTADLAHEVTDAVRRPA